MVLSPSVVKPLLAVVGCVLPAPVAVIASFQHGPSVLGREVFTVPWCHCSSGQRGHKRPYMRHCDQSPQWVLGRCVFTWLCFGNILKTAALPPSCEKQLLNGESVLI